MGSVGAVSETPSPVGIEWWADQSGTPHRLYINDSVVCTLSNPEAKALAAALGLEAPIRTREMSAMRAVVMWFEFFPPPPGGPPLVTVGGLDFDALSVDKTHVSFHAGDEVVTRVPLVAPVMVGLADWVRR